MTERVIRQSELSAYWTCPRNFFLGSVHGGTGFKKDWSHKPAKGTSDLGTLIHDLAHAYRTPETGFTGETAWRNRLDLRRLELAQHLGLPSVGDLPKEWKDIYRKAEVMFDGYVEWLGMSGADAGEKTLGTELEISVPLGEILGDQVTLLGHIDHLVYDSVRDEVFVSDYKKVGDLDQAKDTLPINTQGRIYCVMAGIHTGKPVHRFRHDMFKDSLRTARATPPFYERYEAEYNNRQLDNTWAQMIGTVTKMVRSIQYVEANEVLHQMEFPPNPGKDCTWRCPFLAVCPMMDDGSNWQAAVSDLYVPRVGKEN